MHMLITILQAAGGAAGGAAAPAPSSGPFFLMLAGLFAIMYFLMIRPQSKRYKAHQAMVATLKRGDKIVTNGGLVGKITKVTDDELTVDNLEGGKFRVARGMVMTVVNAKPANDTAKAPKKDAGKK